MAENNRIKYFFEVVPLVNITCNAKQSYTYSYEEKLPEGTLVRIHFGRRFCDGITISTGKRESNAKFRIKSVSQVIFSGLLGKNELESAKRISMLYQAPLGNTLKLFVSNLSRKKKEAAKGGKAEALLKSVGKSREKEIMYSTKKISRDSMPFPKKIMTGLKKNFLYVPESAQSAFSLMRWVINSWVKTKKTGQILVIFPNYANAVSWKEELKGQLLGKIFLFASQMTLKEKGSLFEHIAKNEKIIIFGTKGLLFLPNMKISALALVSEEDAAYKQREKEPRYHALSCAKIIAGAHRAKFGAISFAPRPETFFESKRDAGTEVINRLQASAPCFIFESPNSKDRKEPQLISRILREEIAKKIGEKKKILVVIEKSGSATRIICAECGANAKCPKCGRLLRYSELNTSQFCQRCGIIPDAFPACSACGHFHFHYRGRGSETVQKQLKKFFPAISICEVDEKKFQKHPQIREHLRVIQGAEIVIAPMNTLKYLIGMNFGLIAGLPRALWRYQIPEWNAESRRFEILQLLFSLLQVADAGSAGEVYVPFPANEADFRRRQYDFSFDRYVENELSYRKRNKFPPFGRIVKLTYRKKKGMMPEKEANNIIDFIKKQFNNKVSIHGPYVPLTKTAKSPRAMIIGLLIEKKVLDDTLCLTRAAFSKKFSSAWEWESDPQSLIFA